MHAENPNIRHVPRGPPPPHPGRLDKSPPHQEAHKEPESGDTLPAEVAQLNYEKYLREVNRILESDPNFKKKLHNATRDDVMSGKLANELHFASHQVRTQLDEAKRREIERLRGEFREMERLKDDRTAIHEDFIKTIAAHMPLHKDPKDVQTFSTDDFNKLIKAAIKDLDEIDRKRREAFKHHEMERELERRKMLEKLTPEERAQKEREFQAQQEKLRQHKAISEPGHKANLEEVWEKQDHLEKDTFDPKTFFNLHDMNGDGHLDELELEALFVKEVESIYGEAERAKYDPEELERLKEEQMARMREHVMEQVDADRDRSVSFQEFLKFTQGPEFEKDKEWKAVSDEKEFTEDELLRYEKELEAQAHLLDTKKQKLREFKERKMKEDQEKGITKPQSHGADGAPLVQNQQHRPPSSDEDDFYYDIDGERVVNYDAKIDEYDDYSADFEDNNA